MKRLRLLVLYPDKTVKWHTLPWGKGSLQIARQWGYIVYSEVFYES